MECGVMSVVRVERRVWWSAGVVECSVWSDE